MDTRTRQVAAVAVLAVVGLGAAAALGVGPLGGSGDGVDTGDLPPGVEQGGVTDASALVAAHNESLSGVSYRIELSINRTETVDDSSLSVGLTQVATVDPDHRQFVLDFQRRGLRPTNITRWANRSVLVTRQEVGGNSRYIVGNRGLANLWRNLSGGPTLDGYISAGQYDDVQNVGGGENTLIGLEATSPASDAGDAIGGVSSVGAYDGTVLVRPDGRIQRAVIQMSVTTAGGEPANVTVNYELQDVGSTTVSRPPWVQAALANASASFSVSDEASVSDN